LAFGNMSTPVITAADMIGIQLRKWVARGHVHNVKLKPAYSHPTIPAGETPVAEVVDRRGTGVFFTGSGFTMPGRGFVRYEEVLSANWISGRPERLSRKREDFDHIELSLRDGSSATLADLDQAVFPVLRFFQWVLEKQKGKAEPSGCRQGRDRLSVDNPTPLPRPA
jgi:hypothetical protein